MLQLKAAVGARETASSRAMRSHSLAGGAAPCSGAGAVSRMNSSSATRIAAASSGEALAGPSPTGGASSSSWDWAAATHTV